MIKWGTATAAHSEMSKILKNPVTNDDHPEGEANFNALVEKLNNVEGGLNIFNKDVGGSSDDDWYPVTGIKADKSWYGSRTGKVVVSYEKKNKAGTVIKKDKIIDTNSPTGQKLLEDLLKDNWKQINPKPKAKPETKTETGTKGASTTLEDHIAAFTEKTGKTPSATELERLKKLVK